APNTVDAPRIVGPNFTSRDLGGSQDAVAHWVSKLFDKKWQLEASLSYHRERLFHEAADPLDGSTRTNWQTDPVQSTFNKQDRQGSGASLSWFANYESPATKAAILANCDAVTAPMGQTLGSIHSVRPQDAMLNIVCPALGGYTVGGRGSWEDLIADRLGTRLAGTNFVRGLGHHQFMYGWDMERNNFNDIRIRGSQQDDGFFLVIQRTPSK